MKKLLVLPIVLIALALSACNIFADEVKISISQFVEHPALDAVNKGFKDDLAEHGVKVIYKDYNAHGNMGTAGQITNQIVGDNPDLMVAIATPVAQACAKIYEKAPQMKDTPMLFTAITDPKLAGLVDNYEKPGGMITGVSNQMPMDKHLEMIKKFIPGVKKVGAMYNAGEVNSVTNIKRLKAAAEKMDIEIVDAPVTASADVYQSAQSLVGKVDCIYVPTDNTVVSALEAVIKVCQRAQLPLFNADVDSVKRGSIAAMGFDYYLHGKQTGAMARRILAGEKPGNMAVEFQKDLSFHINPEAAKRMGLEVDKSLIESADKVH